MLKELVQLVQLQLQNKLQHEHNEKYNKMKKECESTTSMSQKVKND